VEFAHGPSASWYNDCVRTQGFPSGLPRLRIDPGSLPPLWRTSDPGSFAHYTFQHRIPRLLDDLLALIPFPEEIQEGLRALRAEVLEGTIRPLTEEAPDRDLWDRLSAPYVGGSWQDAPWYWAEAFFYRRLLEATRYFQPGPWWGLDPFGPLKRAELKPGVAALEESLAGLPEEPVVRLRALLFRSLWGNRFDLSLPEVADAARAQPGREGAVLADDTGAVCAFLMGSRGLRVALVADNAGSELLADLALIDFLLETEIARRVVLHLKWHPFFVSDATPLDLFLALEALQEGGTRASALAERLWTDLRRRRLATRAHWFFVTSLFYFEMPDDLAAELGATDLVVLKGDANYRRLVGDARWDPGTPLERAAGYFPAPFVALRTLKSEVVVGLTEEVVTSAQRTDPEWMTSGRWGVIQARLARPLPDPRDPCDDGPNAVREERWGSHGTGR
jgi:hypothetical protein